VYGGNSWLICRIGVIILCLPEPTVFSAGSRKIWIVELGYSFDTRYMDKWVKNNNTQNCAICLVQRGMN